MKNIGKKFEEDFIKSVPADLFLHRIKDGSARTDKFGNMIRLKNNNLCDFILYNGNNLYLLELKTVKNKSMSFNNIAQDEKKQLEKLEKLLNETKKKNTKAGYLINFRSEESTYYIPINEILDFYNKTCKKSINITDVELLDSEKVPQIRKRVRYTYNLDLFA